MNFNGYAIVTKVDYNVIYHYYNYYINI